MSSLADLAAQTRAVVSEIDLPADLAEWLAAVGLEVGVGVRVLRRAAFGGPLHVRTDDDGEFAVAVSLARSIRVEVR